MLGGHGSACLESLTGLYEILSKMAPEIHCFVEVKTGLNFKTPWKIFAICLVMFPLLPSNYYIY